MESQWYIHGFYNSGNSVDGGGPGGGDDGGDTGGGGVVTADTVNYTDGIIPVPVIR